MVLLIDILKKMFSLMVQ